MGKNALILFPWRLQPLWEVAGENLAAAGFSASLQIIQGPSWLLDVKAGGCWISMVKSLVPEEDMGNMVQLQLNHLFSSPRFCEFATHLDESQSPARSFYRGSPWQPLALAVSSVLLFLIGYHKPPCTPTRKTFCALISEIRPVACAFDCRFTLSGLTPSCFTFNSADL